MGGAPYKKDRRYQFKTCKISVSQTLMVSAKPHLAKVLSIDHYTFRACVIVHEASFPLLSIANSAQCILAKIGSLNLIRETRFSKVLKRFRTQKAVSKSQTL